MPALSNCLIFGGTFDPIHYGHLNIAQNVQKVFNFDKFIFLPCKTPLLKEPAHASPIDRIRMLEIAITPYQDYHFCIDRREIDRSAPSYMTTTLQSFRRELGQQTAISLLLGMDSFVKLSLWHDWKSIIQLTNILVVYRPGITTNISDEVLGLLAKHESKDLSLLQKKTCGVICQLEAGFYNLSSTQVRAQLEVAELLETSLIPPDVFKYIEMHNLYKKK